MIAWCSECKTNEIELEHSDDIDWCWVCYHSHYPQRVLIGYTAPEYNTVDLADLRELREDWQHYVEFGY